MPPPTEQVELQKRSDFVDVPLDDQLHQPQSSVELNIPRRVAMATTVVLVTTVATVALLVTTASVPQQQQQQQVLMQDYHQPGIASPVLVSALQEVMAPSQSSALPSPLQGSKYPKNVIKDKIRKMKEKHMQRNVPDPNYEEVAVQLKQEREHDSGFPLPSSKFERHSRPYPLPSPDPGYVEEEVTLEKYEEHDKHPRNVKVPVATRDTRQQIPFSDQETTEVKETESNSSKIKKSPMENRKESNKLSSKNSKNGTQICETIACYEAATRISESMDLSVNPCDDFYQFACGGWIDKHPPPASGWGGTYIDAVKRTDNNLLLILETPAKPDAPAPLHDIRSLYSSCLDTDTMDELGLDPLVNLQSAQGGWPMVMDTWDPNSFSLSTALNNLRSLNVYPLVRVTISTDIFNTSRWLIFVDAGELPTGVSIMGSATNDMLAAYHTFMTSAAKMLRDSTGSSVSDQDIDSQVNDVIEFEKKFSEIVLKAVNETTNNAWQTTVAELQEDTDAGTPQQFVWLSFLKEMFAETDITITKDEPLLSFKGPFFKDLSNLLATTDHKTLANAIGWWWVYDLQEETTYAMRNASNTYMQDFYGQSQSTPQRKHCLSITSGNMGFALSREYVDHFVPHTVKPEVKELVEDLREAFSSLLNNNTWMLPDDLEVAKEKLAAIDPFVAYPDWIMDDEQLAQGYEGLDLVNGKHIDNLVHIGAWYNLNALAALRDVPEHSFLYPPTLVNSVYTPTQNSITILSGMLQSPFYVHNAPAAVNYGSIGMIIGHEMTHGFDSIGRMFDKFGNVRQWWSDETIDAFNEHAMCFVKQYDKYVPPELSEIGLNITVNGVQTLAENIADNGGIREAFKAYKANVKRYGEELTLPGLEDYSPEHIFYLSFANPWCELKSPQVALQVLFLDAHSPGKFRVIGPLSNDEEFSRVWNCPAGSPMNNGKDRCLLW